MQTKDQIMRASWNQLSAVRDVVVKNVHDAVRTKIIAMEPDAVQQLLSLISSSVEEGYHKGTSTLEKEVDMILSHQESERQQRSYSIQVMSAKKK